MQVAVHVKQVVWNTLLSLKHTPPPASQQSRILFSKFLIESQNIISGMLPKFSSVTCLKVYKL